MPAKRTQLEQAILKALEEGPGHGAVIEDRIEKQTGNRPGALAIYPVLHGLRDDGLLTSHEESGPAIREGRPRTVYTLVKGES